MNILLQQQGYVIYKQEKLLYDKLISGYSTHFSRFCATWNDLPQDPYLLDGGQYRYRRYSVFNYQNKKLTTLPNEPHYQTLHYNSLHGGINRYLEPWLNSTINNPVLLEIINWVMQEIDDTVIEKWRIQSHQFRIVASDHEQGKPTPEGVHKDGADYIFIMLIQRENIIGGKSMIYDNDKKLIEQVVLKNQGDTILLNDRMVYHGVSEVKPMDYTKPALRDVLVLTFHQKVLEGIPLNHE